jgi:alpha-D-ribose 1-methylphosphonate 5-triphosphate synthase subunit PhnH
MNAMARPGKISTVSGARGPAPLSDAAAVLLLTLCDAETPIFLGTGHDVAALRAWISFHTAAPFVTQRSEAMFALGTWTDLACGEGFAIGTSEYPDRSTTLIVEMEMLTSDANILRGPGIETTAQLSVPDAEFSQANAALFPLGVDLFLTCGTALAALPRTTKVEPCM